MGGAITTGAGSGTGAGSSTFFLRPLPLPLGFSGTAGTCAGDVIGGGGVGATTG